MIPLKLGVLGGIGPEATGIFYLKLIQKLQSEKLITKNEDFPQIFINSIPAPELIFDDICKADLEMYIKGLQEIDSLNPDFIIMICNTIHLYHPDLQSKISVELIDLREEVKQKIKTMGIKSITIFGTPSTISLGLYNFPEIDYLNPDKEDLRILSQAVFNFNKGIDKEIQRNEVEKIARKYLSLGSQLILLGCTEFAVMMEDISIPKLNTINVLVDIVVERYRQKVIFNIKKNKS